MFGRILKHSERYFAKPNSDGTYCLMERLGGDLTLPVSPIDMSVKDDEVEDRLRNLNRPLIEAQNCVARMSEEEAVKIMRDTIRYNVTIVSDEKGTRAELDGFNYAEIFQALTKDANLTKK